MALLLGGRTLPGAPGIARSKDATSSSWSYYWLRVRMQECLIGPLLTAGAIGAIGTDLMG